MKIAALSSVVATTTSATINIENLENVSIQIIGASISSGNGVFEVLGSNDGTNFKELSNLIDNSTTPATRVASKTLSANGNNILFIDNSMKPAMIQVKVTRTTDGTYSAIIAGQKKI